MNNLSTLFKLFQKLLYDMNDANNLYINNLFMN